MKIKKGDPVRVRLVTGEVVDAVYDKPLRTLEKCHHVNIGGAFYIALGGKRERRGVRFNHQCRFVGPTPIINLNNRGEK